MNRPAVLAAFILVAVLGIGSIAAVAIRAQDTLEARCKALGGVFVTGRNSNYCFKEAAVIPLK